MAIIRSYLSIIASLAQILGHGRTCAGCFELPSYESTMLPILIDFFRISLNVTCDNTAWVTRMQIVVAPPTLTNKNYFYVSKKKLCLLIEGVLGCHLSSQVCIRFNFNPFDLNVRKMQQFCKLCSFNALSCQVQTDIKKKPKSLFFLQ